jgi:phosphatidate cytidylyltransferase
MTRLLSGAVLLAIAIAVVWFAPAPVFLAVAELMLVLASIEYVRLARAGGHELPAVATTVGAAVTSVGVISPFGGLERALIVSLIGLAVLTLTGWRGKGDALANTAVAVFPVVYLGVPIGAMVSIQTLHGREQLFLLMLTVFGSDTGQYYSGRLFGRTPLAPIVSPKKTVEGAAGGFVCGVLIMIVVGAWWLPAVGVVFRALLGAAIVALGIAGDLFESMLKRSAGVKDSSTLIPGHGGVLDRIDALLFAAPVYFMVLEFT